MTHYQAMIANELAVISEMIEDIGTKPYDAEEVTPVTVIKALDKAVKLAHAPEFQLYSDDNFSLTGDGPSVTAMQVAQHTIDWYGCENYDQVMDHARCMLHAASVKDKSFYNRVIVYIDELCA